MLVNNSTPNPMACNKLPPTALTGASHNDILYAGNTIKTIHSHPTGFLKKVLEQFV